MRTLFTFFILLLAPFAVALELVMVEQTGCVYCEKWNNEIAPIYPKTEVAKRAPLSRIDIKEVNNSYKLARPVIYTPTFLLIDKGAELDRIEGYQSPDFFWAFTEKMVNEATARSINKEVGF